ncbi:MAG TPA: DUF4474 domain-containing protein [Clostridia bacterium]|nr:DUF4474 domain-containing protein [Clostridia bacterium]
MLQFLEGINLYLWIPIVLAFILAIAALFYLMTYRHSAAGNRLKKGADIDTMYEAIKNAGYSYDPNQDIFYSNMDSWQRKMGYCRLYDEALAPLNMIIDCEPIYFEYGGKRWLIEFWKGQYGMTIGGEIGVYTTEGPDLNIPGFFDGTFYNCASNADRLYISYSLVKDGELLFRRKDRHWWLTGFKLGEFSEPSDLKMYLTITLKDAAMRKALVKGLMEAGYSKNEIFIDGTAVSLIFDEPHTPQPITRIAETDWLIQRKNELLCDKYQEITGAYDNLPNKMNAIRDQAPEIYDAILNIGKSKALFEIYEKIKDYLN